MITTLKSLKTFFMFNLALLSLGVQLNLVQPGLAQTVQIVRDFDSTGTVPHSSLIQASDGFLYGTTQSGGAAGQGTVYRIDATGTVVTVHHFWCGAANDGCVPVAGLIQLPDGFLYGTTQNGGANGQGTVFKLLPDGSNFSVIKSFQCGITTNGCNPVAGLIQLSDGFLYGTTQSGGANNQGTVFKVLPDGNSFSVINSFQCVIATSGCSPVAGLIQLPDGFLYGTTPLTAISQGMVFKVLPDGSNFSVTKLFQCGIATNGCNPKAGLIQLSDGFLYGTTQGGGASNSGTVFKVLPDGNSFTVIKSFQCATNGCSPLASLIQLPDGFLYGTTASGGASNQGTAFKIKPDGSLFAVTTTFGCFVTNGCNPQAGLIQLSDGFLYGTTQFGGASNQGTVFKLLPDGSSFSVIKSFQCSIASSGCQPQAGLIQFSDGFLYGTTTGGGPSNSGTVFKVLPDGNSFSVIKSFQCSIASNGCQPLAGLIQLSDGFLYGTTQSGGANNQGTVFKVLPDGNSFSVIKSFQCGIASSGCQPQAGLIQFSDGFLYGTTQSGGANNQGTVFKVLPDGNSFSVVDWFACDGNDGCFPRGNLIQATNGYLYGPTQLGGQNGGGTIFRIVPPSLTQTITVTQNAPTMADYNTSFIVAATGGGSGNPVVIAASGACSGSGNNSVLITMTSGTGTCAVTYNQAGGGAYLAAPTVTQTTTAEKATPVITWNNPADISYPTALSATQLKATANVPGSFTYSPVSGTVLNAGNGQTLSVTFTPSDTTNYNSGNASVLINVLKAASTVTLSGTGSFVYNGSAHGAGAIVTGAGGLNQPLTVVYSGNCSAAPIDVADTPCNISASYAGDTNHNGSSASGTINIAQASSTTTVTGGTFTYDGNPHPATVSVTGTGGLSLTPVATYSGGCLAAPVNVSETTPTACTASYTYSGDGNHSGSSGSATIVINKATATLTLSDLTYTYDGTPKTVTVTTTPTGLTGVSVTYNGSPTGPTNAGNYAVVASLTNTNYAATDATGTLTINQANQTITFGALAPKTYGDPAFQVSATASSGLAVTFVASGNCTVSGDMVQITGAGSCTVTAQQAGNGNYAAAPDVPQSFNIAKAAAVINLSDLVQIYDGLPESATVTTNPPGLEGSVTVTYNGSPTAPSSAGSYAVAASLTDANYAASDASGTLAILLASAGSDQSVNEGDPVDLSGTGYGLTYQWTQVSPASPVVTFSNPTSQTTTFAAPELPGGFGNQTFTFAFTASDGTVSTSSQVNVTVKNVNHAPVAETNGDQTVAESSPVTLNGSPSYDPDSDSLVSYQWVQTDGPTVTLTGANSPTAAFTAPSISGGADGATLTLKFALTVSDGDLSNTSSEVVITVEQINHPPVANAGPNQTRNELTLVTLDGSGSSDPDSDPLTFSWSQVSGPSVTLSNPNVVNPTFTAPSVGPGGATLGFQLVVSDGLANSSPANVTVQVQNVNDPPACNLARPSVAVLWPPNHKLIPVSILGVTDPNNDGVAITITGVTQDERVNGLGDGDTSPDAVIQGSQVLLRAERSGNGDGRVYQIRFTASDGQGGSCGGLVNVSVPRDTKPGSGAVDSGQAYDSTQP